MARYSRTRRAAPRRASSRRTYSARRPARTNSRLRRGAGRSRANTIRLVIEQPAASAVARPELGVMQAPKAKAKF